MDGDDDDSDDYDDLFTDYAGMMRGLYPGQTPNPTRWEFFIMLEATLQQPCFCRNYP